MRHTTNSIVSVSTTIAGLEDRRCNELAHGDELTAQEIAGFQAQLWSLLQRRAALYTSGESSSIPELTAHRLLSSICYVLDIERGYSDPFHVRELLDVDVQARFQQNLRVLEDEVSAYNLLWEEACLTTPLLESVALKDTLESMRSFVNNYDFRYFAHEIPCDIDYPLCHPVSEQLQGISYLTEYLKRLIMENGFLQAFDVDLCQKLLLTVHADYRLLLINLFEPVATNAIGLCLAGRSVRGLSVGPEEQTAIREKVSHVSRKELKQCLDIASEQVCSELRREDEETKGYLQQLARSLAPRIQMAVENDCLGGIFLQFA